MVLVSVLHDSDRSYSVSVKCWRAIIINKGCDSQQKLPFPDDVALPGGISRPPVARPQLSAIASRQLFSPSGGYAHELPSPGRSRLHLFLFLPRSFFALASILSVINFVVIANSPVLCIS